MRRQPSSVRADCSTLPSVSSRAVYSPPAAKLSLDSRVWPPWSAERARAAKAQEMLELEAAHDGHETPLQRE